jgi:hypothetical protein
VRNRRRRSAVLSATTSEEERMGIGVSLVLVAVGAAVVAVTTYNTIGWILLAVGALGILLSLVFWSTWGGFGGRRTTVIEE